MKYSAGPLSHEKMMRSIELYGRKVIPLVRQMLAEEDAAESKAAPGAGHRAR